MIPQPGDVSISWTFWPAYCFWLPQHPEAVSCTRAPHPGRSGLRSCFPAASPDFKPPRGFCPKPRAFATVPPPTSPCGSGPSTGTGTGHGEEPPRAWLAAARHMCWDLLPACCLSASFELTYVSIAAHLSPSLPLFPPLLARWQAPAGPRGPHPQRLQVTPGGWRALCLFPPLPHGCVPAGALFAGLLVWMHLRLTYLEPRQFPPSTINAGSKFFGRRIPPFPITPEAAGAALVPAAPSQPSIPFPSFLFLRSHPPATLPSIPRRLCHPGGAGGKPGPAPWRRSAPTQNPAIRDTRASSGNTKASSAGANVQMLFLLLQKALVAAASHFSSFYL